MTRATGVVAAGATVALVWASTGAAASAPHSHSSLASTPKISVTASKAHFKVSAPKSFAAGRVEISLKAVDKEYEAEVVKLKKGYSFKDVRSDLAAFGSKAGTGKNGSTPKSALKHLNRVIKNVNFYGGLDTVPGSPETATVVLPRAGSYLVVNDSGNLPKDPHKLKVTGPAAKRATPKSSATVIATTKRRFSGDTTLPAKGTITFKNESTESPHFLDLLHVKKGTTRKQVIDYLQSGARGAPSFGLQGQAATDVLGEGMSQTLSYKLPKGEYVELCFFPDPKTGMPHALMGMVDIVNLT